MPPGPHDRQLCGGRALGQGLHRVAQLDAHRRVQGGEQLAQPGRLLLDLVLELLQPAHRRLGIDARPGYQGLKVSGGGTVIDSTSGALRAVATFAPASAAMWLRSEPSTPTTTGESSWGGAKRSGPAGASSA